MARDALGLARDAGTPVGPDDLGAAIARHVPTLPPDVAWRMAVHEAGHILVAAARNLPLPDQVTIGAAGGAAQIQMPLLLTAEVALDWTAALLGGRAAEHVLLGAASSGSGDGQGSDLDLATNLLVRLEMEWGLGDCGLMHAPVPPDRRAWLPNGLRQKINGLLYEAEDIALDMLITNRAHLTQIATMLLQKRTLDRSDIGALLESFNTDRALPDQTDTVVPLR